MPNNNSEIEISPTLRAALRHNAKLEQRQVEKAIRHLDTGSIPTPANVIAIINGNISERQTIMHHHAFYKEFRLRSGFDALISVASTAHLDLCRCEAALSAFASRQEPFDEHINHTVVIPAQKELMSFCSSYVGVKDTLFRLKKLRSDISNEIDKLILNLSNSLESRFINDLRNNLSHGAVTFPGWSVTRNEEKSVGLFKFSVDELLSFGDWKQHSKMFLSEKQPKDFAISEVTNICVNLLARLEADLTHLLFQNPTPEEHDFHEINDQYRRRGARQWNNIIASKMIENRTDPYLHLHRIFSPQQIRQIMKLPMHSSEQVEYIIQLKIAESECDTDLRQKLYQLFSVPKSEWPPNPLPTSAL